VGVFYNPNIHPIEEFERRRDTVKQFAEIKNLKVEYFDDFRQPDWGTSPVPSKQGARCVIP
jgi:predicted adenine nucleotide alpha hydrolase (AANH) superfamily ATPase